MPVTAANSVDGGLLVGAGIYKRFGALTVLDGVNFTLAPKEAVGIVGPNGAGKTTLLNVLAGGYRPTDGTVTFDGADVTTFNAAERCRLGIARSHQIPRPFGGMTVFENCLVAATTGGGLSGQKAYRCCVESLELCQMLRIANRRAETGSSLRVRSPPQRPQFAGRGCRSSQNYCRRTKRDLSSCRSWCGWIRKYYSHGKCPGRWECARLEQCKSGRR